MRNRPSSLFRGSELPRLMLLAALVLIGWPMIVLFARPQAPDAPPPSPPSVPVEKITKLAPDEGIEFQALQDKKPIEIRDSAAYALLLQRARETPPDELAKQARRDVFWTQLWERPKAYRGVPIHLEGTAKKVLSHEVGPSMSPKGRLYELWVYSDENRAFPYVVTVEDAPPGLAVGHELHQRVKVDGYFLKQLGYLAGDGPRAAPMLVGRVNMIPAQAQAPAPMVELREWSKKDGFVILLGLLVTYILIRTILQVRKVLAPSARPSGLRMTDESLPPEEVADWLRNLPEGAPGPQEDVPILREGSHLRDGRDD